MDQMYKKRIFRMFYKAYVGRLAATTFVLEGVKYEVFSLAFNTRFGNLCIFGRSPIFDRIYNSYPICYPFIALRYRPIRLTDMPYYAFAQGNSIELII